MITVQATATCTVLLKNKWNKYGRLRGRTYIHTCRSYVHMAQDFTNGASLA